MKDSDNYVRRAAASALGQLGVKDPAIIQDLRNLLKDSDNYVRRAAASALGQLGVKDPAIIQDLRNLLKDSEWHVRSAAIKALNRLNALTVDTCIEILGNETEAENIVEIYLALLRINPEEYVPFLATNLHPDLLYFFMSTLYFQGAVMFQKEGQLFLNETLLDFNVEMIQRIHSAKVWFTEGMSEYSESIQSMSLPIGVSQITYVLTEDFLTTNLPIDELSESQRWKAMVDSSFSVLFHRIDDLNQDVAHIKEALNQIKQQMETEWENVKATLSREDGAYINQFKQQLVQMYIVANVALSGDVQMRLTGTAGTVVTVLDVIAGLVPWGGGAVQMLSYLTQAIAEKIKQNRIERVLRLGGTPEEVAKIATILGQRLLHCLEIEHFSRNGRMNRLFNSLGNLVGSYAATGLYGALFEAFTESGVVDSMVSAIVETMTLPDIEERASQDAQLLLSAIMEEGVPHNQDSRIDIDRLFLYSAPLLTVIDRIFIRIVGQYCDKHGYDVVNISKVKHRTQFCAEFAEVCHKRGSATAVCIEDLVRRNDFIENVATECNRRNILYRSKELNVWSFLGKKNLSMTLSINKKILEPESAIIEEIYTRALK